jgi:predicted glycosyltransferase
MLAVCNHLVDSVPDLSILLVSGSPMVHSFRIKRGIDYIKLPCLTRTQADGYAVKTIGVNLKETVELRADLIQRTVSKFKPDVVLVDKKPFGVENELLDTLDYVHTHLPDTKIALLLRDVLDSVESTTAVWKKNHYYEAVRKYYDLLLVVGSANVFDLSKEYRFPPATARKVQFCGYIGQDNKPQRRKQLRQELNLETEKLVLVTVGGGEDGYDLIKSYLAGLAQRPGRLDFDSLIVCGPEMAPDRRAQVQRIAAGLAQVQVREFVDDMLSYMDAADVVVSMGGYNTVCELLSLGKQAVIVPRVKPVQEQWIRAERMANLGLFRVIHPDVATPANLGGAVAELVDRNGHHPSAAAIDLDALPRITAHINHLLREAPASAPVRELVREWCFA